MILDSIIVEQAVRNLIPKIDITDSIDWRNSSECDLLKELVLCTLSSNIRYEVAVLYTAKLEQEKCFIKATKNKLDEKSICRYLTEPILLKGKLVRYRFPKTKSNQLYRTINNIYGNSSSIKELLSTTHTSVEARDVLTCRCTGIGYKQASMFLRNIGYGYNLAIIDTHIIDYLNLVDVLPQRPKVQNHTVYSKIEKLYSAYAQTKQFDIKRLDIAIWNIMKIYKMDFA